ncbi:MAG: NifU family protein [Cytophagales bacterium]|nr:MAG: NifU family protein [Cytophagales bacterium]TAF60184.1 MAG: NifU family protein [Cytophagales bacterium]
MTDDIKYNADELYQAAIHIYTEATPNSNSMKFMLSFLLMHDEQIKDYDSVAAAEESPLAQSLFAHFDFIKRVFMAKNFVTITKESNDDMDWYEASPLIRQFLRLYFEEKKPVFVDNMPATEVQLNQDTPSVKRIKDILNEYIRPAVEMDGGAIFFHSFEEMTGTLKVTLQGSCKGCPSSVVTLKQGIENLFRSMMPEVKEVMAEN